MPASSVKSDDISPGQFPSVPLEQVRSRSFEIPRGQRLADLRSHTHFAEDMPNLRSEFITPPTTPTPRRPGIRSHGNSFAHSISTKRRSVARTVSSYSVYSHFAGERFDDDDDEDDHPPRLKDLVKDEKKRRSTTDANGFKIEHALSTEESAIEEEDRTPKASVGKAMFMFLKAFIGSGVLFLPKAFENGGLALSIVLLVLIAAVCLFAFLRLVKTQLIVGGSYGDIGGLLYGQAVRYVVLVFLVISQIGFVCSYFIFISGNLVSVVDVLSECRAHIEQKYFILMPLVFLIPFALVRHIARLSFAAVVADILILFGLICIIYFTSDQLHNVGVGPNIQSVNPANFALMIGTATFSFEVIPIVESMKQPERFPFVVTLGMVIVCLIYILIGTLSYLAYGDTIQAAVIYNFPPANRLTITVQLLYSAAIILTAPLMLFPALKILENAIFQKRKSGRNSILIKWGKNLFRTILAIACALIAFGIGGENLDKFVSLVGSVACVPLCFIFPGMFHFKITTSLRAKIFDILLIIWGVGIMIYTLYVTINSFVHPTHGEAPTPYCPA
ncbi:neutral amino acid transporter [Apophysomyces sp. BC1034]|nr:neutral amino acid transporter [Apophysomyces sp. BC1015]KAG0177609.1 neutral amino acid transporter [Apophysomyces sp. BC1021]KAG0187895.1 neutral amino acid transporter [Apophysomyces sp. BC1034]